MLELKRDKLMPEEKSKPSKLGEWVSTAICGNDILSSSLYVSGIAILFAGVYAPIVFLLIAFVLYLYKSVYIEVVEALRLNGGAYNCLINSSSKSIAAIAGITTFLSYVATSVISAKTAVDYVHTLVPIPVIICTLIVLGMFGLLVITGIKGSSKVALVIFIIHMVCLTWFLILGLLFYLDGHSFFINNLHHTNSLIPKQGGLIMAIFFAFSASLLGVSGFESSADFVEDQERGVFRKTLRNMLIGVAFFNPLITLVVLNSMNYTDIAQSNSFLLANVANVIGGKIFQYIIVIDAFLVLSGAVLAAYISVSGLLSRMAADDCMPHIINWKNSKGAYPIIIILFFILCCSILLITQGNLLSLAGVYTIAFLGVMTLFAFGNLVLKETRKELRRTYTAPVIIVVAAALATLFGIVGNIRIDTNNLRFFQLYFIPLFIIVIAIIYQNYILLFLLRVFKRIPEIRKILHAYYDELTDRRFVAFVHNNANIFKILHYIDVNETGRNVILVHCVCQDHIEVGAGAKKIEEIVYHLQQAGAFTHFKIQVMLLNIPFGPNAINEISRELNIKKNKILIGSIHNFHPYDYASLGGVRVIF